RGEGEPLQHLLGTVEFCGATFLCDKRGMVPRPETEELVELLLKDPELSTGNKAIIDIGTGSGVIALSLAAKLPEAAIRAIDISEDALTLARENAARLGLDRRVEFGKGNLLENINERFDLVVANLPYISMEHRQSLSREVLRDPEAALFGGERGDELIRLLIDQARARLHPNGLLALEIGADQSGALQAFLLEKKYHDIEAKNDYSSTPRFVFARYG
ncbi:MAG: prmC, partial [Spartobacteria bacterium]|nr:prmC [Spartobacteria bacterium]